MRRQVGLRALVAAAAVVLLAACSGIDATGSQDAQGQNPSPTGSPSGPSASPAEKPPGPQKPYSGYPDSLAVLSHSASLGIGTRPYKGWTHSSKTNSWVTGTNPAVNSIYQRILAKNPAIKGHAKNLGAPSASIFAIDAQASRLIQEGAADLVIIQTIDADITCPNPNLRSFGDGLAAVLDTLRRGSPNTRVFVTTQFGSPKTYAQSLRPDQRRAFGGTGPCAFLDPRGQIVPKELRRLESIIQGYEQQVFRVCEHFKMCYHDGGAFSKIVERPSDFGEDLDHFSIQGHARAAEVAWKAMHEAGLLPAK